MNENIKEIFEEPKLELILFSAEDVVTASVEGDFSFDGEWNEF